MNQKELADKIQELLNAKPGQTARQLADQLGVERREVNSLLYGKLKPWFRQDNAYRWHPNAGADQPRETATATRENTDIARLVRYYLACLGQDERGVSVFASGQHGLDYVELDCLPDQGDIFSSDEARDLMSRARGDRGRMELFFGYPTLVRQHRAKSGWQGAFVEPLFLFPVDADPSRGGAPSLEMGFPQINQKVLIELAQANRDGVMEELVQLEEELGLTDEAALPDLEELVLRLHDVRSSWPWLERPDPDGLVETPPLSRIGETGLCNRAVLLMAERSPFTKGLETELKQISQMPRERLAGSSLGQWLDGGIAEAPPADRQEPLLEVLPMNTEQRQAVSQALNNKLTVITGPPGTGKSQVVTNLLVNAAWQGKRVLFASKNNKAVDVVEQRINELGPRPILLRLGSSQYQGRLADYLLSLLSTTPSPEDHQTYADAVETQKRMEEVLAGLDQETERLLSARNQVDALEQSAERARKALTESRFASLREIEIDELATHAARLQELLDRIDQVRQGIFGPLIWRLQRNRHFESLQLVSNHLVPYANQLGLGVPPSVESEAGLESIRYFQTALSERLELVTQAVDYFDALGELQQLKPLEDIAAERARVFQDLSDNAATLWQSWLVTQSARVSREDRQQLSQYQSMLRMVLDQDPNERMGGDLYRRYQAVAGKTAHLMPCWAVTSLSAKGKIPLENGFFDLVIFDESSQCDIASALPLLFRSKAAAVIGDPRQLTHISSIARGQDLRLLEKHSLLENRANWAYSYNSLFDLAAGLVGGADVVNLRDHHRSHADIIEFSNAQFYEGRLRVATRHDGLRRPAGSNAGIRWLDVRGQARRPTAGGAVNQIEGERILEELHHLREEAYEGTIGVVTPFRAQANLTRELVNRDDRLVRFLADRQFLVDTVHKFQGDERDLMIFSPTVAHGIAPGSLGFLRSNGNLFNVAITRARGMLLVVGDLAACSDCGVDYLEAFSAYVQRLDRRAQEDTDLAVQDLGPEYPAVNNPHQVSDWERLFYKALYRAGIRAIPQYQVEQYTLDFALIDGGRCLDIEIDGERYHRNWTGELCRRDQLRNQRLFELGWDVMRFWVYEVRDDLPGCIERVRNWQNRLGR